MMKKKIKKTHGIQLLLQCIVTDPDGKIITDTGQKLTKSFLIQFFEFFYHLFRGSGGNSTATDGTEDPICSSADMFSIHFQGIGSAADHLYGIVVGTGSTAETNTDHKLDTQLTEGVGAGNISHGIGLYEAANIVGANVDFVMKRPFTNLTGSAIAVRETGIYVRLLTVTRRYHCIVRDVFPGPVNVPDNCTLNVFYTLRTTV